jgi:hypothetical protein
MIAAKHASRADRRAAHKRAEEWRQFRQTYLYNQRHLARALGCSRRCISGIETAETTYPYARLLARFAALKRKHEREAYQAAERRGELAALRAATSGRYGHIYSEQRGA